jgi:hypothetical protein
MPVDPRSADLGRRIGDERCRAAGRSFRYKPRGQLVAENPSRSPAPLAW